MKPDCILKYNKYIGGVDINESIMTPTHHTENIKMV